MNAVCLSRALALSAVLCLAGCVLKNPHTAAAPASPEVITTPEEAKGPVEKTEFSPSTWIYRNPARAPRDFAKLLLPTVEMYENMSSEVKKRDRRYLDEVGVTFQKRIQRLLEKDYLPVAKPDPLTLEVQIRLTRLQPTTRLFNDRHERVKLGAKITGTKLEADCYDSMTHELIFAVSTFYEGDEYAAYENPVLIKNIRGAFGEWSDHFKRQFDDAMAFN